MFKRAARIKTLPQHTLETRIIRTVEDFSTGTRTLNQYSFKDVVGEGSFGVVSLAIDETGHKFAIKEISKSKMCKALRKLPFSRRPIPAETSTAVASKTAPPTNRDETDDDPLLPMRKEIAILKKLRHPHIIRLYEVLEDQNDDSVYMVFEHCSKGALMDVSMDGDFKAFKEDLCWKYFRQLVLGIDYLHRQKIAHRDIKPDNLLLDAYGNIKIADFGVSEMFGSKDLHTKSAGSPCFMAPELLYNNHGEYSMTALDRWSMGVTLYCMVYGRLPFSGRSILDLNDAIRNKEPWYSELTSPSLIDLMQKLMKKRPEERINFDKIMVHPWITRNGKKQLVQVRQVGDEESQQPTHYEVENAVKLGMIGKLSRHIRAISSK